LLTKLYVDFRSDDDFEAAVRELSRALVRRPRVARPTKRASYEPALDSAGIGAQLRERFAGMRSVLGTAMAALEDYADVVQALLMAGRWSTVVGVAEPAELTHAEAQARRAVRTYNAKLSDALLATRHILLNAALNQNDQTLFYEIRNALDSLEDASTLAERAVAEIRHGKSPKQVFSENTQLFADHEGRLRLLLSRIL
jgi:hypothetical protein